MPALALTVPLPVKRFPNKLAPKVPNNIPGNPPFCFFDSLLIVSLTPFINKAHSSSDLTIFIISFISAFEAINVVTTNPNIFLCIAASIADASDVDPDCIKTLLVHGLSTFPIKDSPIFSNGPTSLPKNTPDCPILSN